ncbi:MAG: M20/M25/M40 family metallo-hydrolase [Deltaproteobacteria bacterium]|nr:M20/M25/M40 family metallo-hydrolase [Deltaproteobacteria bacterium]MBW2387721.1 M20/M25/M40 family metallo-hydrolase [Deltaproteobacteria bacterium]MBW2724172.1 M20/M25/M40 family metallo-hydrolase [Deltaproteobacteria bacterium]
MYKLVGAALVVLLLSFPAALTEAEVLQSDDFEAGFGTWSNVGGDDIDWTRNSGGTPSNGTGPSGDHSTGSGFYLYTEASNENVGFPNKTALLESPCIDLSGRVDATWTFWTHMNGSAMGILNAEVAEGCGSSWTNEWSLSGEQGSSWNQQSVDLSVYVATSIKLRFRGVTGSDFTSDMAIDDVLVDATAGMVCTLHTECNDGISCTADACVGGFCQNSSTCTGNEICDPVADMCALPPAQQIVDSLDLARFKSNIQKLSSQDPSPPPEDPLIDGSRHWTQTGNDEGVDWIAAQLESYGYINVVLDSYTYQSTTRYNVYATKIGTTHPEEMYIISAHLDSKTTDGSGNPAAAGADDDASGTSAVLEAARVFGSPDVQTEYSIRFAFWNNEETGLNGSAAYVNERLADRGIENPPGSGKYPEPAWRGMIQHDMILWDHGFPYVPGAPQSPTADIDIEYDMDATFGGAAIALANSLHAGNVSYATDYPAEVTNDMSNTDSARFQAYTAAVSMRENRRLAELGNGSNPQYHTDMDVYESYSDLDFLFGFNVVQSTVGTVAELSGASVSSTAPVPTLPEWGLALLTGLLLAGGGLMLSYRLQTQL